MDLVVCPAVAALPPPTFRHPHPLVRVVTRGRATCWIRGGTLVGHEAVRELFRSHF
jgi:hypothetical protein